MLRAGWLAQLRVGKSSVVDYVTKIGLFSDAIASDDFVRLAPSLKSQRGKWT